ncbi:DMT family transporter [Boseongicola aestuarii]|uniref:EamA-like transporter family protein n=1 Tax=Boseongicola aestuarii TaxID=1470561 RepID=A0A238IZH6_9RHOB|nr:DMT family transporter [Boseongicola aestuarii]SMX23285.1 EamA-like transporter family protein [Boseongicola aestuarii]
MQYRYWAIIFLLGFGWGSSFFFNEILLRELGPFTASLGRIAFGALGCWLWVLLRRERARVPLRIAGILAVFGLFQYTLPLTIYPYAQQFITSSAAGIVNAMTPIMVVLVSHAWPGGEKAVWTKSLGVALGFLGMVIVIWPEFGGLGESNPCAMLATISAPLCYGIAVNMIRYLEDVKRTVMTAWSLLFGALLLAPLALGLEGMPIIVRPETWASLMVIGFVLTSVAFILIFWLIPRVGGTSASTITLIAPISSIWLGVVFLNEEVLFVQGIGMIVIFVGLLCIDGRILRVRRKAQPSG